MPDTMTMERRKVLVAFGAKLVLTPGAKGMKGAIAKAEELAAADPGKYVLMRQFDNPANPAIHEKTTGPEIWEDTQGKVDVFVSGVGTGGTLTGVSRYIKNTRSKKILTVAVEPTLSPIISQTLAGQPLTPSPHKIQGNRRRVRSENLDLSLVDRVEQVTNEEAIATARSWRARKGFSAAYPAVPRWWRHCGWRASRHTRARPSSWFFRTPVNATCPAPCSKACSRMWRRCRPLLVHWKKSPAALFSDISFVSAGKKRRFCQLRSRGNASPTGH